MVIIFVILIAYLFALAVIMSGEIDAAYSKDLKRLTEQWINQYQHFALCARLWHRLIPRNKEDILTQKIPPNASNVTYTR